MNAEEIIRRAVEAAEAAKIEERKIKEAKSLTHERTPASSQAVMEFVAFGVRPDQIATIFNLNAEDFKHIYAYEIKNGSNHINDYVAGKLYELIKMADPKTANNAAQFWLTHKAGWRPPPKELDVTQNLNYDSRDQILTRIADSFDGKTVQ